MQKGQTNNRNGRPRGSANLMTRELRELIRTAFNDEINSIPATLKSLEPKERLDMLNKFLPYLLPKLSNVVINDGRESDEPEERVMIWRKATPQLNK